MKQYYLKGFKKRYSIREDGVIIRHYKYNRKGEKYYEDKEVSIYLDNNNLKKAKVGLFKDSKVKVFYPHRLMVEYFNLKEPDNFHRYTIAYKDGNPKNVSLSNLYYKILTNIDYNYEPKAYSKNGKVYAKKCGCCGVKKPIQNFTKYRPSNRNRQRKETYRNKCEQCRSDHQWKRIKSNPELLRKHKKRLSEWAKNNRDYYNNWLSKARKEYPDWYVRQSMRKSKGEVTKEQIDVHRNLILINKEIKKCKEI